MDRKLRRLDNKKKAVFALRDVLERREATVRREEAYVRDERRQQATKHARVVTVVHRQRVQPPDQHTTSTQTDATQTQSTLLLAQQWIQQHRHDTGTQTDATQTQTQPIQLEEPIQLPPQLLPMLPPLPMPPSFRTFQPPQPPSLPALTRREIETLGRAKLRQYLGLLGESQQGNPEDLRARMIRYFDALGIDIYYPPG